MSFRLDSQSVVDLVLRNHPDIEEPAKDALEPHREEVLGYFDARFRVGNGESSCSRDKPLRLEYAPAIDKVVLDVLYRCPGELREIRLWSELFLDEDTPHQVLGTLRHARSMERYVFTGAEREVRVSLELLEARGSRHIDPIDGPAEGIRDATQTENAAEQTSTFAADPQAGLQPNPNADASSGSAANAGLGRFFKTGVEHIFGGWDHLVFVLTLALAVGSWKRLALVVTSFTMAHSLTLAMTAVGLVRVSPALVEPAIAATIVWAAVDLFRDRDREPRLGLTFAFGLIHGLGFGGTMLDLGLEGQELVMPLLGFNLGVEAGQLLAVLPAFALFAWLSSHRPEIFAKVQSGGAIVCGLAGAAWLVARIV